MACYIAINGVLSQRPSVELVHALIEHALLFGQYRNGQQEHDGLSVICIGGCIIVRCIKVSGVGIFLAHHSLLSQYLLFCSQHHRSLLDS
jgi:hypothetical protein